MLESNTDRMYYTIGAILVAAAIIGIALFIVNGQLQDGLAGVFNGLFSSSGDALDNINGNVRDAGTGTGK